MNFKFCLSLFCTPVLQYELTLVASDTLRENSTKVRIRVKDINDLPPKFDQSSYETTILEEDSVGLPKGILKVVYAPLVIRPTLS